jgi:periplasmic copper chaperone A
VNRRITGPTGTIRTVPARALAVLLLLTSGGPALAGCSTSSTASVSSGSEAGTGSGPELSVEGAYIPEPVTDAMAAGYFIVTNEGDTADKLTGVTSDLAGDITMHRTVDQRMKEAAAFTVPAHGELDLERGGNHLMFMELKRKPDQGEKVSLELHFEKAGVIKVEVPVEETTYNPKNH